jgi:hypothetical protein
MALLCGGVLVSPVGLSAGALFSVLVHTSPRRLVLIAGPAALSGSAQALDAYAATARALCDVEYVLIEDPWGGFLDAHRRALSVVTQLRESPRDVAVNLTGGTTALQYCALCVGLGLANARLVAVTDGRSREAQATMPFVVGKLVEVPRPITITQSKIWACT